MRALLPEYYLKTRSVRDYLSLCKWPHKCPPSKYTTEAVDEMTSLSAKFDANDSQLGFALRAGLVADQDCPMLKKLLESR